MALPRSCVALLVLLTLEDWIAPWHAPSIRSGLASACVIQGQHSGQCVDGRNPDVAQQMPFCSSSMPYSVCVPRSLAWAPNITIAAKDDWVRKTYERIVGRRIDIEENRYPSDMARWEGTALDITRRFYNNEDCQLAFHNYICWMNFPRCDAAGESLSMCLSACENFFRACRYPKDMWRCYDPAYYGGQGPENDAQLDKEGVPIYLRALFQGLPFTANQYEADGETERPICTPGLTGGAAAAAPAPLVVALSLAGAAVLALVAWRRARG